MERLTRRYIDANDLQEQLERKKAGIANQRYTDGWNDCMMRVKSMVSKAPTANVAPVAYGRWDGNDCTVCKLPWNYNMVQDADDLGYFDPMPDYCPNCGARMDGWRQEKGNKVMDAVKFLQERKRMFLSGDSSLIHLMDIDVDPEVLVRNVEQWSAAHPRKTRQDVFLEQYPEAKIDENGSLAICPYYVSSEYRNKYGSCAMDGIRCADCRREFWTKGVK